MLKEDELVVAVSWLLEENELPTAVVSRSLEDEEMVFWELL